MSSFRRMVPWTALVVVVLVIAGLRLALWWFGPLGGRAITNVSVLYPMSVAASQTSALVSVELRPIDDPRNALLRFPIDASQLKSRLQSELVGSARVAVRASGAAWVTAAFVIGAADAVGPHEVYLYGMLYRRGYAAGKLVDEGFLPVRIAIDPRGPTGQLVTKVEIEAPPGEGRPIRGPYPRWVDAAFGGSDSEATRLLGSK